MIFIYPDVAIHVQPGDDALCMHFTMGHLGPIIYFVPGVNHFVTHMINISGKHVHADGDSSRFATSATRSERRKIGISGLLALQCNRTGRLAVVAM